MCKWCSLCRVRLLHGFNANSVWPTPGGKPRVPGKSDVQASEIGEPPVTARGSVGTREFCSASVTVSTFALNDLYMTWPEGSKMGQQTPSSATLPAKRLPKQPVIEREWAPSKLLARQIPPHSQLRNVIQTTIKPKQVLIHQFNSRTSG